MAKNIVQNVFEIPGEFLRVAKQQIIGPLVVPEEKQQAVAAKRKLPALIANDQKVAAAKISQLQQQLRQPLPEIKSKPKPPISAAVKMMLSNSRQTRETQGTAGG